MAPPDRLTAYGAADVWDRCGAVPAEPDPGEPGDVAGGAAYLRIITDGQVEVPLRTFPG